MASHGAHGRQLLSCGRDLHNSSDISQLLAEQGQIGYDFIALPIVHPRNKREYVLRPGKDRNVSLTRADVVLSAEDWSRLIVGKVSPWIDVDSDDPDFRYQSEKALIEELEYMCHLQVPAVMVKLKSVRCANLASIMYRYVTRHSKIQAFWVHVPMVSNAQRVRQANLVQEPCGDDDDPGISADNDPAGDDDITDEINDIAGGSGGQSGGKKHERHRSGISGSTSDDNDPWEWWNTCRMLCNFHRRIGLVLEMPCDLPEPQSVMSRWLGETLRCVMVPTESYITNKRGYPVLCREHQNFLRHALKFDMQVMITGRCQHPEKGMKSYHLYLQHLHQTMPEMDPIEAFAKGFEDYLQVPLQPLSDNLESQTYETFEKDPTKYTEYQKAIYQVLLDKVPDEKKNSKTVVIMVLGAGRGPLVKAALNAADKAGRNIRLFAIEKNPNAAITLRHKNTEQWGGVVEIVCEDMREWEPPVKADLIISELLGSFGDNELSPECLDGAQKYLNDDGVSIPQSYTSYLSPLHSPKLHQEVQSSKPEYKHPDAAFHCPYVVRLHNRLELAQAKPLFTFTHPNWQLTDNSRYGSIVFDDINQNAILHGFAGYFYCSLYKDVNISIVPQTHSPGMFSWFPVYFPLQTPARVRKGDVIEVHFWRRCNRQEVWYEWALTRPNVTPIHNLSAGAYSIKLA